VHGKTERRNGKTATEWWKLGIFYAGNYIYSKKPRTARSLGGS